MFSGAGLFRGDLMFALVSGDALYFKVSEASRPAYLAAGARVFTYSRLGAQAALTSYYEVPPDILDDPDALADWARQAWVAAQSNAKAKTKIGVKTRRTRRARRARR
jgi:DNA transformation protein